MRAIPSYIAALLLAIILCDARPARCSDEETLGLFSGWQDQPVSTGRAPRPLSRTPENVTVITAAEIEALNPHTLTDILATVPGVQLDQRGGPGSGAFTLVQGSQYNHVLILVDGVPLNNLADNFSDVGLVPVQQIERIEIVKGAASSAWGQALGGVINVITKSPETRPVAGVALASIGERYTTDTRGELSGTVGRLGYYLSGGYLGTDGLTPHHALSHRNLYAKLLYNLPGRSSLTSTFSYSGAERGNLLMPGLLQGDDTNRYRTATLGYRRLLGEGLEMELSLRHSNRSVGIAYVLANGAPFRMSNTEERFTSGSAKLIWRSKDNLLVAGGDYENVLTHSSQTLVHADLLKREVDRWGIYLNDTYSAGRLSLSPGARFDRTRTGGDQFSPSFGFTWQFDDATLLRGYTARGYSLPGLSYDAPAEKVWTSQLGIESSALPYLWLKATLFRNQTWGVLVRDPLTGIPAAQQHIALGGEIEARTVPVLHTSLGAGYTYVDKTRSSDGGQVYYSPRHTLQLALRYDDPTLRALLTGRHIWWNAEPGHTGRYYGLIWDLHLGATLVKQQNWGVELFCSGRNLFNNKVFTDERYPTPGRWFDGGMRVRF